MREKKLEKRTAGELIKLIYYIKNIAICKLLYGETKKQNE